MLSWEQIERDKKQIYMFLKHVRKYHPSLYTELISKELELPGGKITTLDTIINVMEENPMFDMDISKKLVNEYMPNMNTSYEPDLLKALHILLYTTPYTVIEKNIKALILYLIHQEQPHLKKLEHSYLEKNLEYGGKRRSKNKRKCRK